MKGKITSSRRPTIGYVWVSKAHSWQTYKRFNSSDTDVVEWFNTEEEAKNRAKEMEVI